MKRISIWIAGSMALVAFLAIDFAVIPAFQNVETLPPRVGLYGVLPMAYVLTACLVVVVSRLVYRSEVPLSTVAFLLFGGTATLALVAFSNLAPQLFFMYISNTAGLWVRPGQQVADVFLFGTGGNRLIQALVIGAAVTPAPPDSRSARRLRYSRLSFETLERSQRRARLRTRVERRTACCETNSNLGGRFDGSCRCHRN